MAAGAKQGFSLPRPDVSYPEFWNRTGINRTAAHNYPHRTGPVRPGQDWALLLAMVTIILDEGLHHLGDCTNLATGVDRLRGLTADVDLAEARPLLATITNNERRCTRVVLATALVANGAVPLGLP